MLWSEIVEGAHWQVDLDSVGTSSWGLVVRRDAKHVSSDLAWDLEEKSFLGDAEIPSRIWKSLSENLEKRSHGIQITRQGDLEFLQHVVSELNQSEWISGRKLRQRLKIEEPEKFLEHIVRLSPRYLRIAPGKEGDFYSPTLPGLLLVGNDRIRSIIRCLISALVRKYVNNPDAREYGWPDLEAVGLPAADIKLAWTVASITLLARGGSLAEGGDRPAISLGMPLDAEQILIASRTQRFDEYVLEAANRTLADLSYGPRVDRPWASAPAHLEIDGEPDDYVSAALTGDVWVPPSVAPDPWAHARLPSRVSKQGSTHAKVDLGIVTVREDELEAILTYIPSYRVLTGRRQYNLARLETAGGGSYEIAIVRGLEVTTSEASEVSRDLLEELSPTWLLVVGTAVALSEKVRRGDVVVSSRVVEVTEYNNSPGQVPQYSLSGGATAQEAAIVIANLPSLKKKLGPWNEYPRFQLPNTSRLPKVTTGIIASSSRITPKSVETLSRYVQDVAAIDMESCSIYQVATRRDVPLVSIRGISHHVGEDEDESDFWPVYASHAAAAFTAAFLRTGPIAPRLPVATSASLQLQQQSEPEVKKDSSPFRLQKLTLTDVRAFENLQISFEGTTAETGQWVIFIGMNGSGKTSILRAITMALSSDEVVQALLGRLGTSSPMVRIGAGEARILVECPTGDLPRLMLGAGETGDRLAGRGSGELSPPFVVAYGCRRGSALGGASREVNTTSPLSAVETLFEEGAALVHAETWLKERKFAALDREDAAQAFYRAIEATLVGGDGRPGLLPGITAIHVTADRVEVEGPAVGRIPFGALSDGYLTTAGWILDMIARWSEDARRRGIVLDGDFRSRMTGVAIVDEIDLHIHPRWQREVIKSVREHFPRMSFIVTTHNPLTILGGQPGEIYVLERDDAGRVTAIRRDLPLGADAERILTGEWFGLPSTLDDDTLRLLTEHRQLLRAGAENDPKAKALEEELAVRLGSFADTSIERLAQSAAAQVLDDENRQLSAADRQAAMDKIAQLLQDRSPAGKPKS